MKRSILIVCALGCAILLGTLVTQGDSPDDPFGHAKPAPKPKAVANPTEKNNAKRPEAHVPRTGTKVIEAALEKETPPIEFVETPIKDVVEYLKDAAHIEIWLDEAALKEEGLKPELPVSCNLRGCRLENSLNLLLNKHHLAIAIHDNVLWITSESKANEFVETHTYDVADLVIYKDEKDQPVDDYDALTDVITNTVCPYTWDKNGGKGSISGASLGTAKVLVVSSTRNAHREIAELLAQVRAVAAKKSAGDGLPRKVAPTRSDDPKKQPSLPSTNQKS